jgi:hypothetical protein
MSISASLCVVWVSRTDRPTSRSSTMQYAILIYGDQKQADSMTVEEKNQDFAQWMQYSKDLAVAGVMRGGEALQPTGTATTVRVRNGKTRNTDGPFAETKEQLGGFYLIDVPNLDDALSWAAKCPGAAYGSIEVRPIMLIPKP